MKQKSKIKKIEKKIRISQDTENLNKILVENFVSLQKAVTNLAVKFDSLSENISKLLQLFEISAKSFAEKLAVGVPDIEKDREFLEKLNKLLEQNKVIAKGLTLMEEKLRERLYGHPSPSPATPAYQKPQLMPRPSYQASAFPTNEGYIPSSLEGEKSKLPLEE